MTTTIRRAEFPDLPAVRELLVKCDLPLKGLEDQFGDGYCVAVDGAQIVGVGGIEVHGRFGLLRSVAVLPRLQSRGLGPEILKDRLVWAKGAGLKEIYLLTTTAARFFERHGFQKIDRAVVPPEIQESNEFASVCPGDATVMVLRLQEA